LPAVLPEDGDPRRAFQTEAKVSEREMLTLPTQTQRIMVSKSVTVRKR
jgi:hypothetical protein